MTTDAEESRTTPEPGEMPDRRETPFGTLYRPRPWWVQVPLIVGAFAASIGLGEIIGVALGGVSEGAQVFLYIPFILVLAAGYSLWMARLQALAFDMLGRGLLKALFILIVRRRKPEGMEELIPTPEKLEKMAVRAQQASSAFWIVAIPIGMGGGAGALLIGAPAGPLARAFSVAAACLVWGYMLAFLARRGWLPILDEE